MLAGGLHQPECGGAKFPRRLERRVARVDRLIDRAEAATDARKARRRLRAVARSLDKAGGDVGRLGTGEKITPHCAEVLQAKFAEGERRSIALAPVP